MGRTFDPSERSGVRDVATRVAIEPLSTPVREEADRENPGARLRQEIRNGDRQYSISPDERKTMADLGRFRVIASSDLSQHRYRGQEGRMQQDLRSLVAQGLIERKTVWTGKSGTQEVFYALKREGKRLVERDNYLSAGQAVYSGFVKPAELRHDAAIYRMYQLESQRIAASGGRVRRVLLDYELKKNVFSPLAKAKSLPGTEYAQRQAEIAREHGLKVVNGHIALPDLRIEYELPSGAGAQVDLEVASESYHGSHAAEKASAGFTMYAAPDTAARLSAALDEREITAEILCL